MKDQDKINYCERCIDQILTAANLENYYDRYLLACECLQDYDIYIDKYEYDWIAEQISNWKDSWDTIKEILGRI